MRRQRGGRRDDGVGVGVVCDGEGVGEDGGGDEEPSMLMDEKVGTSSFSTEITLRLPESAGGEGSSWRGGRGGGSSSEALVAASARAAWCAAARWLRRALARGPRRRWRRPVGEDVEDDSVGGTGVVAISSFILVLPPTVVTDKAEPPAANFFLRNSE